MSFGESDDEMTMKIADLWERGSALYSKHEQTGDLVDLENAILLQLQVVDLIPDDDDNKPACLNNLGLSLDSRFQRLGNLADIDNAIVVQQQAVDLTPDDDADKPNRLDNLGDYLLHRFARLGDLADIDNAIIIRKQAVDLTPDDHAQKPVWINNLGVCLQSRFERLGNLADIDNAITLQQQAVDLAPDDDADKPAWLNNLSTSLLRRFERLGDLADVENAVIIQHQAVDLTPDGHADKPSRLSNLGLSLQSRFEQLSDLADIDNAIVVQQQSVDLTPDDPASKAAWLNNLGNSLLCRFERLGNLADIDNAIVVQQQSVDLTPDDHTGKPTRLSNLGNSLLCRFERLGDLADVDNAILAQQQSVDLTPDGHPNKPVWLSNLGCSLHRRYERLEDLADLDKAIIVHQNAVDLTPDGHAKQPFRLNNLGSSLQSRFERLSDLTDIDKAIIVQQQVIDLTPDGHVDKPSRLSNLGNSLLYRFMRLGDLADIDKAIINQQQAVDLAPDNHTSVASWLSNLGSSLRHRFERLGNLADIDRAIVVLQQSVDLTPDGHANKPAYLRNLGLSLTARFRCLGQPIDRDQLISSFRNSALHLTGPPSIRLASARSWASILHPDLNPYHTVIALIPQQVWLGATIRQRYYNLQQIGDAVVDAVSAACVSGEYDLALEWLEQGRAIIWGQILHLRSPIDDLQVAHPELAKEFSMVASALEMAGTGNSELSVSNPTVEQAGRSHRRLAEKWEELLKTIRALPNFAHFLVPKPASVLKKASVNSTVIVINISSYQCDALILQSGSSSVGHLHLATLSLKKLQAARDRLTKSLRTLGVRFRDAERGSFQAKVKGTRVQDVLPDVLKVLWVDIAKPILDHLGYTTPSPTGSLPHITWCLTGPLATLPLHAAGLYDNPGGQDKLFNYVISSYIPSLTAFLEGLGKIPTGTPSILAITQAATPNFSPLPGTIREVNQIEDQMRKCGMQLTRVDGEQATVKAVSEAMNTHSWVHLSCHGIQNAIEPIKSAFLLQDGPLELAEIMKKPLKNAELAYLSACQTATGDTNFPDEAVHLAAGMFTAGYRSVVATLWSIMDKDAPLVSQTFYDRLFSDPQGRAATALHDAVAALRAKVGEDELISWVPYIHIGH